MNVRRTGSTTRKVDKVIQDLFKNKTAYLYEYRSREQRETLDMFFIFKKRMLLEHPHVPYIHAYGEYDGIWCYKITIHSL